MHARPTCYRRQEGAGWGKAEADLATGGEGAKCEKLTSHGGGRGPGGEKERSASDAGVSGGKGETGQQVVKPC